MEDNIRNSSIEVTANGTIDRRDFGLTWNKAFDSGGVVAGHEARIQILAEFVRPANKA